MARGTWLAPGVLLLACASDPSEATSSAGETGADESTTESAGESAGETTTSADVDSTSGDGDSSTTSGDGDGTTGDGDGDGAATWRFIAMGDGGEGNASQYAVANAVEMVCAATGGCDFVLYLGDNFYDTGVDAVTDMQFTTKFEDPYADLEMPFWIVMGNHDYGTLSNEWGKVDFEIEYTAFSTKWTMPDKWYSFNHDNATFFGMDTSRLMWDHETSAQQTWLDQGIANSTAPWKFAFAHHPYISNGAHGNAGNFEGISFIPQVSGETVQDVIEASICDGKVDIYFNGHDHNRQWLEPVCGTQFLVTGAAAKTTDFSHRDGNATAWESDTEEGFLWVEVQSDTTLLTRFYDLNGTMQYERGITK